MFPSESAELQVLNAAVSGPSSIRLNWRLIQSALGYRLEWREGEGQMIRATWMSKNLFDLISIVSSHNTMKYNKETRIKMQLGKRQKAQGLYVKNFPQ